MLTAKTMAREQNIAQVAGPAQEALASCKKPLLINDRLGLLGAFPCWNRYCSAKQQGEIWPTSQPRDAVLIRLLRDKNAMRMALHAAATVLQEGASLWVVGANDEGIKSVVKNQFGMPEVFADSEVIDVRKRCRLVRATRTAHDDGLRADVEQWRQLHSIVIDGQQQEWCSWPGLFAKGRLDAATEFLLRILESDKRLRKSKNILDFGCGTGVISQALSRRAPQASIDALDADALAIKATAINCPEATGFVSDGFAQLPSERRYDLIVSNPPVHFGKSEDHSIVHHLIHQASAYLKRRGRLIFVIRRQIPVGTWLQECFSSSKILGQTSQFRVWSVG